jgi:hypothetical protein
MSTGNTTTDKSEYYTVHTIIALQNTVMYITHTGVGLSKEAKYVESWPSMTSAWAGWSRFDIPVDRYGGVHSLLLCTNVHWGFLPATRLASRIILIEPNIKKAYRASTLRTLWDYRLQSFRKYSLCTENCTVKNSLGMRDFRIFEVYSREADKERNCAICRDTPPLNPVAVWL